MKKYKAQYGFTLIELLIAASLISIILSITFGSYIVTARCAKAADQHMTRSLEAAQLMMILDRHLRSVINPGEKSVDKDRSFDPLDQRSQNEGGFYVEGSANTDISFEFITAGGGFEPYRCRPGVFKVHYSFDRSTHRLSAVCRAFSQYLPNAQEDHRSLKVIAENVHDLKLRFYNGRDWLNQWQPNDPRQLPAAVRIEIEYITPNRQRLTYSMVVPVMSGSTFAQSLQEGT